MHSTTDGPLKPIHSVKQGARSKDCVLHQAALRGSLWILFYSDLYDLGQSLEGVRKRGRCLDQRSQGLAVHIRSLAQSHCTAPSMPTIHERRRHT